MGKEISGEKEEGMAAVGKAKGEWEASMVRKAKEGNGRLVWRVIKGIVSSMGSKSHFGLLDRQL